MSDNRRRAAKESRSRCKKAYDDFDARGPFTADGIWPLILLLDKHGEKEDLQCGDILDLKAHKFPPEEFAKLLNMKRRLTATDYAKWKRATENWKFSFLSPALTDQHLPLIAESNRFEKLVGGLDLNKLSTPTKILVLTELRNIARKEREEAERDESPERS